MSKKGQKTALTPAIAEKYREVVRLRAAGLTFDEVAQRVGYASRSSAKEAYDRAIKSWGDEAVDDLRKLEGERVEQLWRRVYGRLIAADIDDIDGFTKLLNASIRVCKRRAELLGLDAPQQVEIAPQRIDVNIDGEVKVDVETREQRVERIELVLGALIEAGAVEGIALVEHTD